MNPEQVIRQIKYTAKNLVWTGTTYVFGSRGVIVSSGFPDEHIITLPRPCFIINDGGGTAHQQNPLLFAMTVEGLVFVENIGEIYGEAVLLGGNRNGLLVSGGAGLLQIENYLLRELRTKQRAGGINITLSYKSAARPVKIQNLNLLQRGYVFDVLCSQYDVYDLPPCSAISVTAGVNISWTLPVGVTTRFDYKGVTIIRKQNSDPTSVTDGTAVYTGTATSTTNSPGAGHWHYAVYICYDENEDGTTDSYSSMISGDVTV